jgi:hypothetical protein
MLASVADTAARPEGLEVILVIDADDPDSVQVTETRLRIKHVIVPPGQTMGALNMAGYEASRGRYLMLLNDDVIARTPAWDDAVRSCFAAYPDEILLVHLNDLVMQKHLCTFPIVSRTFCELVGGICPRDYVRYRIDDHIEDYFNLLNVLGERRIIFTPNVVFEHMNYLENRIGLRQYFSDPAILAVDAPRFDATFGARKELALRLKAHIAGRRDIPMAWRRRLERVRDPFVMRLADRQRILTDRGIVDPWGQTRSLWQRARACVHHKGWFGLAKALARRLMSSLDSPQTTTHFPLR